MIEQALDLDTIGNALEGLFPNLRLPQPIRLLGQGFSSLVIETADGVVFRIARNAEAAARHNKEAQLLRSLKSFMPLPVPDPQWLAEGTNQFPFGVMGYRKLSGAPMHPTTLTPTTQGPIARALASFLCALHTFSPPAAVMAQLDGPTQFRERLGRLRADVLPALQAALVPKEYHTFRRWWDEFLGDPALQHVPTVLLHGDLWYENILTDATPLRLAGILDFEDSALGDPSQDFATLNYFGPVFVKAVITHYQTLGGHVGSGLQHRIQRYWELRDFGGLQYAIRYKDDEEFVDAMRKLRAGPILKH